MRSAVIGFGTLFITFFMFVSMSTLMQGTLYKEKINSACNEAVYQTQVFLTEENDAVESNEDLKSIFIAFLKPQLENLEEIKVKFYTVDYRNKLLDVGVEYSYMPWNNKYNTASENYNKEKICEARRTIIFDGI